MKITDKFYFPADQQMVWKLLMDPDAIAKALPGVDRMVPLDNEPNTWQATAKIGISAVSGTYRGKIRLSDLAPPNQYRLTVTGEGQASIIGGSALLTLSFDPERNQTLLVWDADATISGRLAGVAQRLVGAAATMLANQFFRALARQLPGAVETKQPEEETEKTDQP